MIGRGIFLLFAILLAALVLLPGRGGDDAGDATAGQPTPTGQPATTESSSASTATIQVLTEPAPTASTGSGESSVSGGADPTQPVEPTPFPTPVVPSFPPNELGQIPILEYHHFGPEPEQFVRTPDQFRSDLQWLYENGFYVVNLHDILAGEIDVPAGKRPVALTFDDSPASQFSLLPISSGQLAIDPNCAVGIMEQFFARHPDFGRGGHFSVLPGYFFDWSPDEYFSDQTPHIQNKLRWLIDHGYEIGNHTMDHANLSKLTVDEVKYQLAEANNAIREIVPDAAIRVITLPYGMYPDGRDRSLLRGFDYRGFYYRWSAALLVGANPTASPLSTEYDPFAMARIQAFDAELDKWFAVFEEQPGILYVSDGDPTTVTVPNDLHPWLVGTLDTSELGDRELVRY